MKIGMLTFHRANNLGAVLQASALLRYLQEEFHDIEIIDYYPNNQIPSKITLFRKALSYAKRILTLPIYLKKKKKENRFNEYRNSYLNISEISYYGDDDIKKKAPQYDVLISGSDQILNMTLTGKSTAYYLDFYDKAKKISYASSFGRNQISKSEINEIHNQLSKFQYVSVREETAGNIIDKEIGKETTLVLDPVFLLDKNEWKSRCNEKINLPEKYIFVYSMEVSKVLEQAVSQLEKIYNLPVIVVRGGGKPGIIDGIEDITCGPREFLRYIRDAEFIVTNSFHGVSFSIIFEKNFLCIPHSTRNARLDNIMTLIGEEKKILSEAGENCIESIVDGTKVIEKIYPYIKKSKDFLTNSLI